MEAVLRGYLRRARRSVKNIPFAIMVGVFASVMFLSMLLMARNSKKPVPSSLENTRSEDSHTIDKIPQREAYVPKATQTPAPTSPLRKDANGCILCEKLFENYGDSTPDDLIITGVFGGEEKVLPFIRTLRSVGSKAAVVMVTNNTISEDTESAFRKCGVEWFIMNTSEATHHFYPHSLRYLGYKQYFESTGKKYKRIFHTDAFDVFFQKDPFTKEIKDDRLYLVTEDLTINSSEWNSGWLIRAYNNETSRALGNFTVSCSGTVMGGHDQFMIWLDTLITHEPFWANGRHSLDQAYHNYLLHTGQYAKNGAKIELLGCNSHILTMHYCSRKKKVTKNLRVCNPNGVTFPAVVHQYNRFGGADRVINKMCPRVSMYDFE